MNNTGNYLFVYGTLLDDNNEYAVYLKQRCDFYAKGRFKGKLYDIGEYPGATSAPAEETFVYGSIFKISNPEAVLAVLDEYEGFGCNQPQPDEFIRGLMIIESDKGPIECWVYLYNRVVEHLAQIIGGVYP